MALTDFDLVLFGGSGDLSMRKLLPAMFARDLAKDLPPTARIICVGRHEWSQDEFLATVESTSKPHIKTAPNAEGWAKFIKRIVYVSLNATDPASYGPLVEAVRQDEAITRVYYLATPPHLFAQICDNLASAGMNSAARLSICRSTRRFVLRSHPTSSRDDPISTCPVDRGCRLNATDSSVIAFALSR